MSRSIKFLIVAILMLAPKFVGAKTISYGDQTWQTQPQTTTSVQENSVRNIDLENLTQHILLGTPYSEKISLLDQSTLALVDTINQKINQPTIAAKMQIENGWATQFVPDQAGLAIDNYQLLQALSSPFDQVKLPVLVSLPGVKLADLNNLGINELVATGVSDFSSSSKNRITNIIVGSSKYNGLILQPGEEFSFNKYLGDIDAAHGFTPEQVIKASGIELEFGGGLCQVSTTMFRAAMNAGFTITQRRNHSFAVHYYAPQGTDATIYPGSSDLKFINNFSTPVLIHTYVEAPHVYFEVYGTKDGREVTFDGPVVYDRKPDGSMKATWTRHLTLNGETTDYIAQSNYVSPNLYKKIVAPSTPNPQATQTPANTAVTTN
jgi:vancomycin resistance protein YoaR